MFLSWRQIVTISNMELPQLLHPTDHNSTIDHNNNNNNNESADSNSSNNHHQYVDEDENDDDVVPTLVPIQTNHFEITNQISETATSLVPIPTEENNSHNKNNNTNKNQNTFHTKNTTTTTTTTTADTGDDSTTTILPKKKKCPVTILSGFLGAGKSTLIQYILTSTQHQKRIAVIENEYGNTIMMNTNQKNTNQNTSMESMILRNGIIRTTPNDTNDAKPPPEFIDLPNGCVCCTVKDSLVLTLERLLERDTVQQSRDTTMTNPPPIDAILIECSGLANPGPIASIFWLDDALSSQLVLDGIITMVDVTHIEQQLSSSISLSSSSSSNQNMTTQQDWNANSNSNNNSSEVVQQIAYADRIVLNKIDLLPVDTADVTMARVIHRIRHIHPTAPIRTTRYATIPDLDWMMNIQSFHRDTHEQQLLSSTVQSSSSSRKRTQWSDSYFFENMIICHPCDTLNGNTTDTKNNQPLPSQAHGHTTNVSTITVMVRGMVDVTQVHSYLATILWPNQDVSEHVVRTRMEQQQQQQDMVTTAPSPNDATMSQQQIFRIKGILSVGFVRPTDTRVDNDDDEIFLSRVGPTKNDSNVDVYSDRRRYIVQGVYDLWDIQPCTHPDLFWTTKNDSDADVVVVKEEEEIPVQERISQLIIIGRHLQKQELQRGFQHCRINE